MLNNIKAMITTLPTHMQLKFTEALDKDTDELVDEIKEKLEAKDKE